MSLFAHAGLDSMVKYILILLVVMVFEKASDTFIIARLNNDLRDPANNPCRHLGKRCCQDNRTLSRESFARLDKNVKLVPNRGLTGY